MTQDQVRELLDSKWDEFLRKNGPVLNECFQESLIGLRPVVKIQWDEKTRNLVMTKEDQKL